MAIRKIWEGRLDTGTAGAQQELALDGRAVGSGANQAGYYIVVRQKSGNQAKIGLRLDHGPDGLHYAEHTTAVIASSLVPASGLLAGDADQDVVLCEYLRPVVIAASNDSNVQWLVVEIYEMLKPF